jgi:hypothetical protein
MPHFNEVGELTGLELRFGELTLIARMWAGDLATRVERS